MKRYISIFIITLFLMTGCTTGIKSDSKKYSKYTYEFFGTFNTNVQFMGYTENQEQFEKLAYKGQSRFEELNKLYDIYNKYEGINNIKTINENAGIKPVEVSQEIIDLLVFSKEGYDQTGGAVNIALGPVLSIWHSYREEGKIDPANARIPDIEILKEAALKTDISKLEIDIENKTVFLKEAGMSLDVGAVAKGYAVEIVANELLQAGFNSFVISGGGNVRVVGKPLDGIRSKWGIGIQNPNGNALIPDDPSLDIAFFNDSSLVTSGDYIRYYMVNNQIFHHIIDPNTLMPPNHYRAVAIMTKDSGVADLMSTTAFILPYDKSRKFIENTPGVDAYWIFPDGRVEATQNMKNILRDMGGASSK